MRELLHLYNTSLGDRGELMRRMVPLIVGDLKCARARNRDVYVTHWEEESKALDEILQKRNFGNVGDADRSEWLMIQDFQHYVSDILAWVADTLMPQGVDVKTKGIDAAIELFKQRSLY